MKKVERSNALTYITLITQTLFYPYDKFCQKMMLQLYNYLKIWNVILGHNKLYIYERNYTYLNENVCVLVNIRYIC